MTRFCLPIRVSRWAAFLQELRTHGPAYDLVELWMDELEDWTSTAWEGLSATERRKTIVVFRRDRLDPPRLSPDEQLKRIQAVAHDCAFFDLDLFSQQALIHRLSPEIRTHKLLASHHDYAGTPDLPELQATLAELRGVAPAALKLVTFCHNEADALGLLQLLLVARTGAIPTTVLGMGNAGRITRVLGALWGNQLSFAPRIAEAASAPGQLTLDELKGALAALAAVLG